VRKLSFLFALVVLAIAVPAWAAQSPQVPIDGSDLTQFVDPLPTLSVQPGGTINTVLGNEPLLDPLTLRMCEFRSDMLPDDAVENYEGTWVWGYLVDPTGRSSCAELIDMYSEGTGVLDTYTGPVIVNQRGGATSINYINDLGNAAMTNVLFYRYSTDQTLHWADPLADQTMANECMMKVLTSGWTVDDTPQDYPPYGDPCAQNYVGPVAVVPHLHGGEDPPEVDGGPDQWFTSDGEHFGHKYYSQAAPGNSALYTYPNLQEAAPLWFHDHLLGGTRLNVMAGLAGVYFIEDKGIISDTVSATDGQPGTCTGDCLPANLQPLAEVIPVVIQDRMFDTDGQLFFPGDTISDTLWALNPEHPYWVPEFVGDSIAVNGVVWPYLDVEAKRYRFLFLNGSNARTYALWFADEETDDPGPSMWVISTDGGYLDEPVELDPNMDEKLLFMPGERYEVIVDFSGYEDTNLILRNDANTPYPDGDVPSEDSLGRILQIRVGSEPEAEDESYDPAGEGPLRSGDNAIKRLADPDTGTVALDVTVALTRELTLNEVMRDPITVTNPVTGDETAYEGGPLEVLVNNTKWSGDSPRTYDDFTPVEVNGVTTYYSELPQEGDTEIWEIVNLTGDTHPIHLHLVQFQLINREPFDSESYDDYYESLFPAVVAVPEDADNAECTGGVYCPGFGPPLNYDAALNPHSGGKYGGNPDVTPYLTGTVELPEPREAGWKDTIMAPPEMVTRIIVRWAPTDLPIDAPDEDRYYPFDPSSEEGYVWHCHIIDHEDNEMMRPDIVELNPDAPAAAERAFILGRLIRAYTPIILRAR
jgi:spore coat protein A